MLFDDPEWSQVLYHLQWSSMIFKDSDVMRPNHPHQYFMFCNDIQFGITSTEPLQATLVFHFMWNTLFFFVIAINGECNCAIAQWPITTGALLNYLSNRLFDTTFAHNIHCIKTGNFFLNHKSQCYSLSSGQDWNISHQKSAWPSGPRILAGGPSGLLQAWSCALLAHISKNVLEIKVVQFCVF